MLAFNKATGLAVSVCGANVRPKRGLASSAGALEAESPDPRGLVILRCLVRAASGGCQYRYILKALGVLY